MSWSDYISQLLSNDCCEKAYIFGKKDLTVWASSTGLTQLGTYLIETPYAKDQNKMEKIYYNEKEELLKLLANLEIEPQEKQQIPFALDAKDSNTWYLKNEKGGACASCGKHFLIIATWNENINQEGPKETPQNQNDCSARVKSIGDYLRDVGY